MSSTPSFSDLPRTTGTTSFSPTIADIFEEAFERAGAEMRSGYDFRTARRSLDLLTIEWSTRGLNLWTIESGTLPLVAGTGTYNLPLDTVDLIEHMIRPSSGTQINTPLQRISVSTYAAIPNKTLQARPTQIYINRQSGATDPTLGIRYPTVTLWPVPNDSYTLTYWRMRRIQDAGNGANGPDVPFRMLPALAAGLAYHIAMKLPSAANKLPVLKAEYDRLWELGAGEDRERATLRIVPRVAR